MEDCIEALNAFALRNGRNTWRSRLTVAWYNGDYRRWGCDLAEAGCLQRLRNHSEYGPRYLKNFRPQGVFA